ncbi:zinc-ribbon domain-containing protein [Solidesulfovibrio sp.]
MRCNKCGSDNPDDRRVCQSCGHKLQSGRGAGEDSGEAGVSGGPDAAALRPADDDAGDGGRPAAGPGGSGRGTAADPPAQAPDDRGAKREDSRLLNFQGWTSPLRGLGPYLEACLYAGTLALGVGVCLWTGVLWPLYPLLAVLAVLAWLRRL